MPEDPFQGQSSFVGPVQSFAAVTPSDTAALSVPGRAIWADGAGVVYVDGKRGGTNVPFTLPAGQWVPMAVSRVYSTGTTATGIKVGW